MDTAWVLKSEQGLCRSDTQMGHSSSTIPSIAHQKIRMIPGLAPCNQTTKMDSMNHLLGSTVGELQSIAFIVRIVIEYSGMRRMTLHT